MASRGEDAVLGAGALGLTLALRLTQQGRHVTVFEREAIPGGLAAGFELAPGMWLERLYHHLFRSDRAALSLIAELGLGAQLAWHRPMTMSLRDGRRWQLDSAASLLRFGPLSPVDRIRMGAVAGVLRSLPTAAPLEGRTAAAFLRRTMGRTAYETTWAPLLEGKFGAAAATIAMPWFWARVRDRSAELGYLVGGFHSLYDGLADRISSAGGDLRFTSTVNSIESSGGRLTVRTTAAGGASTDQAFDRVISTFPTPVTCRIAPDLGAEYTARYGQGEALGAHCLVLALDRPLTDAYWLNITDPGYPFMVLVEHTNLRPPAEYGGRHLVYLGSYRPMSDPIFATPPDDLVQAACDHLQRVNPAFEPSWIRDRWAFAAPFAQPVVTIDYRANIPPFETPVRGLFVANMFQVYPHDRGQNQSIGLAERLAAKLAG